MYEVLLVEDVDIVREDIISLIDWKNCGCHIVAQAKNGMRGLELYRELNPDIVITDIMMPIMTGLQMIEQILLLNPNAQFILLTAYEEFDFAKQAIRLGVHSYILKHEISKELLATELAKIKKRLESRQKLAFLSRAEGLKQFLCREGNFLPEEEKTLLPWKDSTAVLLIEPVDPDIQLHKMGSYACWEKLCDKLPALQAEGFLMHEREFVIFLRIADKTSESQIRETVFDYARSLQQIIYEGLGIRIAVAIGPFCYDNGKLHEAYQQTKKILQKKIFCPGTCILEGMAPREATMQERAAALEQVECIRQELQSRSFDCAKEKISFLFTEMLPHIESPDLLERCVQDITVAICMLDEGNALSENEEQLGRLMLSNVQNIRETFCALIDVLQTMAPTQYSKKVQEIIRYIHQNYASDVNLFDLSEKLGISVIYTSQLFKKEVGMTFISYLTQYRMDRAVELLKTGRYKIYEVSEMVGYQTVPYFSKLFKKVTGKKPSDYC